MQTVLLLVRRGALPHDEAMKTAEAIRTSSPHVITGAMLAEFKQKLDTLGRNAMSSEPPRTGN
ncbi:MAG: hypothetical protein ACM3VX_07965 [Bacteroidota bacterium]